MKRWLSDIVWERWVLVTLTMLVMLVMLQGGGRPPQDLTFQLNLLTAGQAFNFVAWEVEALARKSAFGLLAPQRFMDDAARTQLVLNYLADIDQARHLSNEIERAYTSPDVTDPDAASHDHRLALAALREQMARTTLLAEAILGEQVSAVLQEGGFGVLGQILPPVSGTFTPLPYILVVSPRETIRSAYQQQLIAGMDAAAQHALEEQVIATRPEHSAYVTGIGGLALYPSMLLESSSIDWVADVIAHEWAHHYLIFYPLGWYYERSNEARTINETTASLIGEWAGQEVVQRYYWPYLNRVKQLPNSLQADAPAGGEPPRFDFREEMYLTRIHVDQLLAEGEIEAAEAYMEDRRRDFVAQGYRLRRLNQAYFAFHGAYASTPGGAAGADPIGPAVRQLWATSATPREFTQRIAKAITLPDVWQLLSPQF